MTLEAPGPIGAAPLKEGRAVSVEFVIHCDCGARISGRVNPLRLSRVLRAFRAAHPPECKTASREALRLTLTAPQSSPIPQPTRPDPGWKQR